MFLTFRYLLLLFYIIFLVLVPQSILKIQKIVRGFIGRRRYTVFLESRLVELIDIPAATRIQRYIRGYIGMIRVNCNLFILLILVFYSVCCERIIALFFCAIFMVICCCVLCRITSHQMALNQIKINRSSPLQELFLNLKFL